MSPSHSKIDEDRSRAGKTGDFVHTPLDLNTNSIRVVCIEPGHTTSPIKCTMESRLLEDDKHICLSYMWGDEEPSETISVNEGTFRIRRNLWEFLKIARQLEIREPIWIDAICIHQANPDERNHQVRHMASIYARARYVIIYPGHISKIVQSEVRFFCDSNDVRLLPKSSGHDTKIKAQTRALMHMCYGGLYSCYTDLKACINLPYWNRLWIFQEIFLAKTRYVIIGETMTSWVDFAYFFTELKPIMEPHVSVKEIRGADSVARNPLDQLLKLFHELLDLYGEETSYGGLSLLNTARICYRRECSDVRDRWYGCLGVIPSALNFPVDYDIQPAELLLNIVQHFEQENDLHEDTLTSISLLAHGFEIMFLSICLACALTHPMVCQSSIPQAWLGTYYPNEYPPFLLVTADKKDAETWMRWQPYLPHSDHIAEEGWPFYCAVCRRKRTIWGRKTKVVTKRVATHQLWCRPERYEVWLA